MPVTVYWPASKIQSKIDAIRAAARPGSPANARALGDIRKIVVEDNADKLLRGVDRYGRPLRPLADSTLKRRKGTGPPLVPMRAASRFITTFRAEWKPAPGGNVLAMGWRNFLNKKGYPIPLAHIDAQPGSRVPKRDVAGVTPKGWAKVRARMTKFAADLLNGR